MSVSRLPAILIPRKKVARFQNGQRAYCFNLIDLKLSCGHDLCMPRVRRADLEFVAHDGMEIEAEMVPVELHNEQELRLSPKFDAFEVIDDPCNSDVHEFIAAHEARGAITLFSEAELEILRRMWCRLLGVLEIDIAKHPRHVANGTMLSNVIKRYSPILDESYRLEFMSERHACSPN